MNLCNRMRVVRVIVELAWLRHKLVGQHGDGLLFLRRQHCRALRASSRRVLVELENNWTIYKIDYMPP